MSHPISDLMKMTDLGAHLVGPSVAQQAKRINWQHLKQAGVVKFPPKFNPEKGRHRNAVAASRLTAISNRKTSIELYKKGVSQKDIAAMLGVSPGTVCNYIAFQNRRPESSRNTRKKL
jgi:DNA-binding NarL/FixJ family response regulator